MKNNLSKSRRWFNPKSIFFFYSTYLTLLFSSPVTTRRIRPWIFCGWCFTCFRFSASSFLILLQHIKRNIYKASNKPPSSRRRSRIRVQQSSTTARKHQESTNNTNQQTPGSKPPPAKKSRKREFLHIHETNSKYTLSTAPTTITSRLHKCVRHATLLPSRHNLSCCFLNANCRPEGSTSLPTRKLKSLRIVFSRLNSAFRSWGQSVWNEAETSPSSLHSSSSSKDDAVALALLQAIANFLAKLSGAEFNAMNGISREEFR